MWRFKVIASDAKYLLSLRPKVLESGGQSAKLTNLRPAWFLESFMMMHVISPAFSVTDIAVVKSLALYGFIPVVILMCVLPSVCRVSVSSR